MTRYKKIIKWFLFAEFFLLLLYIYQGTIDDFAAKHIGAGLNLISSDLGLIGLDLFQQIPGYYTLISTIILLTNIDVYALPVFPILFVPYLLVSFLLFYALSDKNIVLSASILLFTISAPLTGTHNIFMWPHGFGDILFFLLVCILYKFLKSPKPGYLVCILLIISAVSFISYNNTYYAIFLLICLFICLVISYKFFPYKPREVPRTVLYSLIVLFAFVLGLHGFAFQEFIPLIHGMDISVSLEETFGGFLKTSFFSAEEADTMSALLMQTPQALTYIYVLKYAMYLIIIIASLYVLFARLMQRKYVTNISDEYLIVYLAVAGAVGFYLVTRFVIGQFAIPEIFKVFILSLITLSKLNNQVITKIIYVIIAGLVCMNFASMAIATSNNVIQKDDFSYLKQSSEWYYSYCDNNYIYIPDQLTFCWYYLTFSNHFSDELQQNVEPRYLSDNDIFDLYNGALKPSGKTLVINYRTNYNAIQGWRQMIPFSHRRDIVENNLGQNTIYTYNDDVVIAII